MSSNTEGGRLRVVTEFVLNTIETVKGSKPRILAFAAGLVLIMAALVSPGEIRPLIFSVFGVLCLSALVGDVLRGGTISD